MGTYDLQQLFRQKTKNVQQTPQRSTCNFCGSTDAKIYVATSLNKWVFWRPIYKTERKRSLCNSCVKVFSPSLSLSLEQGNKEEIRKIPVFDKNGNLLPHTHKIQIELLPQTYPLSYLGQLNIIAVYQETISLMDCRVMKIVPYKNQEYYMDIFLSRYGYIFTCLTWQYYRSLRKWDTIRFESYFNSNDKLVVKVCKLS